MRDKKVHEKITALIEEANNFKNVPCDGIQEKKGFSCGRDKSGKFFIYTHRARSKSKSSLKDITMKEIDFIDSTG